MNKYLRKKGYKGALTFFFQLENILKYKEKEIERLGEIDRYRERERGGGRDMHTERHRQA